MPNFSIPLSGLTAESTALSTIANNLSNQNTTGYKDKVVLFSDLFYQNLGTTGSGDPIQMGAGTQVSATPSLKEASTPQGCPRMWRFRGRASSRFKTPAG